MSYEVNTTEDKALLALADYGMGSDNSANGGTMRMVRGELSHVGAHEAQIIDKYGKQGEELVVSLADGGSINPITGKPQYWFWIAAAVVGAIAGGAAINYGSQNNWDYSDMHVLEDLWGYSFGAQGLGIGKNKAEIRAQAGKIADESFETTLGTAERQLGPGGDIMESKGQELGGVRFESAMQSEQTGQQMRNLVANQSFEGASPTQTLMNQTMGDIATQGNLKSQKIIDEATSSHGDVLDDINRQKNMALTDYLASTEEAFPGSSALTDLEAYIGSMQAGQG